MTTTNRSENLRRIINPRNLLIICIFLCILILPVNATWLNITASQDGNLEYSGSVWATVRAAATASGATGNVFGGQKTQAASTTLQYNKRGYLTFNTTTLPDCTFNGLYLIYGISSRLDGISAPQYSHIVDFNPASPSAVAYADYDQFVYDSLYTWKIADAVSPIDLTGSDVESLINPGGWTSMGVLNGIDLNDTPPATWPQNSYSGLVFTTDAPQLCIDYTETPDYALDLSASGTFCYGHAISFNLSETIAQTYGMYDISLYLNGDPVSKYSEVDFGTGPLLWSKTLEPGNWAALGWWVGPGDNELTTWLNFTINSTCDASTFSGTINDTYNPGGVTVYDWEWNAYDYLNNLEPWTVPTFDNGNGTSLIDYMLSEGIINQTEYDIVYNMVLIELANQNNLTNTTISYTYGVLTPFVMINDSISTIRADVNSSYSVLNDAISPVSTIFTWIFQIIPIAVIDLMSVILVFDAVRVILAGRKN